MKARVLVALASALFFVLVVGTASADSTLPVQNPSFETTNPLTTTCPGPGTCAYNTGPIPGWTVTNGGSWQPSSTFYNMPLPDGSVIAWDNGGSISQTLTGISLQPNSTYDLSVYVGQPLNGYFANYTISLDAGSTVLATLSGTNETITPGTFAQEILTYSTGDTVTPGDLSIVLTSDGPQVDFDNVQLSDPPVSTPEPSTLPLLGAGLIGLVMFSGYFGHKRVSQAAA